MSKKKQTSSRVSAIAADLMNITLGDVQNAMAHGKGGELVEKIRIVAASALSQDERKGD